MTPAANLYLVADIGGTHARFAWAGDPPTPTDRSACSDRVIDPAQRGTPALLASQTFPTRALPTFEAALEAFLTQHPAPSGSVRRVVIAAAGPVKETQVVLTNRPEWRIDAQRLAQRLTAPVWLLNDFVAQAYGLMSAAASDWTTLPGTAGLPPQPGPAPIAVIGPGTGLGVALLWQPSPTTTPLVLASEGGNLRLPRLPALEAIWDTLAHGAPDGTPYWEWVLSGPGLQRLYAAFPGDGPHDGIEEPAAGRSRVEAPAAGCSAHELSADGRSEHEIPAAGQSEFAHPIVSMNRAHAQLSPPEITAAAHAGNTRAKAAVCAFAETLAAFAAEAAIFAWASGGVVLVGSIARALEPWLQRPAFRAAFVSGPRYREALAGWPLWHCTGEELGLKGTAWFATHAASHFPAIAQP